MTVDMSAKAITDRLRLVAQLTTLCLALGKARVVAGGSLVPGVDGAYATGARSAATRAVA
jgi:hypothetical protein